MQLHPLIFMLGLVLMTPAFADTNTFPASGNVGIGTTSPGAIKLVVASPQTTANNTVIGEYTKDGGTNSYGSSILRLSRNIGGDSTDLELNSGGAGPFRYGTFCDSVLVNNQNATNGPYGSIHFVTNSAARLTVGGGTLAGYVGIGTTNPLDRLHVNSIRPIIMGYNGNLGVYGSHVGFNMTINTDVVPNTVTKLGGTAQSGGAIVTVDYNGNYRLQTYDGGSENASTINYAPQFTFSSNGRLGIGTSTPSYPLSVNGTIRAKEVIVDTGWSDYVFDDSYQLAPLSEVEAHIKANKHLPGIPSAAEVAEHGVSMGEMQAKLLAKIEEITLHEIAHERRLTAQENEILGLKEENAKLQRQLAELKLPSANL